MRFVVIVFCFVAAGCTHKAIDLNRGEMSDTKAIVMGRLRIAGRKSLDECFVRFRSTQAGMFTSPGLSLDETGLIFTTLPVGDDGIIQLNCRNFVSRYDMTHLRGLNFSVKPNVRNYFGDITITLGPLHEGGEVAAQPSMAGTFVASREIRYQIDNNVDAISKEYELRFGKESGLPIVSSLPHPNN